LFVPAEVVAADAHVVACRELDDGVGVFKIVAVLFGVDGTHFHGILGREAVEFPDDQRSVRAGDGAGTHGYPYGKIVMIVVFETPGRIPRITDGNQGSGGQYDG